MSALASGIMKRVVMWIPDHHAHCSEAVMFYVKHIHSCKHINLMT